MEREPVVIVGAGYVGLTLGLFIASRRVPVLIVDVDAAKVERLQRGECTLYEADLREALSAALAAGTVRFSLRPPAGGARHWIIAVPYIPLELSADGTSHYLSCLDPVRGPGTAPPVVMVRSTVPVGFTRAEIVPRLAAILGGRLDERFFVAACPERTLTGKAVEELGSIPQLVGGSRPSVEQAQAFFDLCGISCIPLENYEAAELGKAVCNLSRLAQFNLANFFGLCCEKFGVNAEELIPALVAQYPRLQLSSPGPGVGGSCLPKDSLVLADGLPPGAVWDYPRQQYLMNERLIAHAAREVTEFVSRGGPRPVLALGIAFKGAPRTDDTRNSVGLKIVEALKENGADVRVHDLAVQAPALSAMGLRPASLPIDPSEYSAILLLNNDPGYVELLQSASRPNLAGTISLYDPWRLVLSSSPSVFAQDVTWEWVCERLRGAEQEPAPSAGIGHSVPR